MEHNDPRIKAWVRTARARGSGRAEGVRWKKDHQNMFTELRAAYPPDPQVLEELFPNSVGHMKAFTRRQKEILYFHLIVKDHLRAAQAADAKA
eukprot:2677420-Alexandrium_andersonii.AAC.1